MTAQHNEKKRDIKKRILMLLTLCVISIGLLTIMIGLIIKLFVASCIGISFVLFGTLLSFIYYSEFIVKKYEKEQKREFKNKLRKGSESLDRNIDKILEDIEYKN